MIVTTVFTPGFDHLRALTPMPFRRKELIRV